MQVITRDTYQGWPCSLGFKLGKKHIVLHDVYPLRIFPLNKYATEDIRAEAKRGAPHDKIMFDWRVNKEELQAILSGGYADGMAVIRKSKIEDNPSRHG